MAQSGTVVIDVRDLDEYQFERIAHSRNIPFSELSAQTATLTQEPRIVVVCQAGVMAQEAAARLRQAGCRSVAVLEGGLNAWKQQGLPVERLRGPLPIRRQVQLIAGTLVLIGALVPGWRWLAALIGAGLVFAGASGHCGMAMALSRMPWNRPADAPRESPRSTLH